MLVLTPVAWKFINIVFISSDKRQTHHTIAFKQFTIPTQTILYIRSILFRRDLISFLPRVFDVVKLRTMRFKSNVIASEDYLNDYE